MPDEMMYVCGRTEPMGQARIPALDAGLLLGAGLFETLRTYGGRPMRLARHMARLRRSGEVFRIFLRETDDEVAGIISELIKANGVPDARIRITATRGPLETELEDDAALPATVIITAGPMTPYPENLYQGGATAVVSDIRKNETDPCTFHKTTAYMTNLLALRDAHRGSALEAIRFNTRNRLAEGTMSNVFLVSGGRLLTPPVEDGLLAGVTREAVLELAAAEGIPAEQKSRTVQDMLEAGEVFITNSIMEIMPVVQIERHQVGEGTPGPVTQRLAQAYRELVARECQAPPTD